MTALHLVQLTCAVKASAGCRKLYPETPIEGTVGNLRDLAGKVGWETMRGKFGRDACPPCRVAEIQRQDRSDRPDTAPKPSREVDGDIARDYGAEVDGD